jgi:hypothetical protein
MRRALIAGLFAWVPLGPHAAPEADEPAAIDSFLEAQWKRAELKAAPPADDATFLRRVTLDLTGTLPEPEDIRAFLKSTRKDKRQAKIDEILGGPKAADYFAYIWIQWLMGHEIESRDTQRIDFGALTRYLRAAWEKDLPYDALARSFLTTRGDVRAHPAGSFLAKYVAPGDPPAALAAATARIFLGRELRCAQCHDHPFDPTTQEEFWGFAAFFRPLRLNKGILEEPAVAETGSRRDDLGERILPPRYLDGRTPNLGESTGEAIARLMLGPSERVSAKAVVDRYWKLFFGRSIAPSRTGPGQPALLELLVREFIESGQSLKHLVRSIVRTRAYQLSSEGPESARRDYALGPLKMMNSVQFLRTWNFALQLEPYFRQLYEKDPAKAPFFRDPDAFWVGQTMFAKELLFPKGRNPEEAMASGTDRLALKLMNNRDLQLLMAAQFGLVRKVMKHEEDPGHRIEELFFLMVSRPPTRAERSRLTEYVKGIQNPYHAYTDIFWMLFNSSEFVFVG